MRTPYSESGHIADGYGYPGTMFAESGHIAEYAEDRMVAQALGGAFIQPAPGLSGAFASIPGLGQAELEQYFDPVTETYRWREKKEEVGWAREAMGFLPDIFGMWATAKYGPQRMSEQDIRRGIAAGTATPEQRAWFQRQQAERAKKKWIPYAVIGGVVLVTVIYMATRKK